MYDRKIIQKKRNTTQHLAIQSCQEACWVKVEAGSAEPLNAGKADWQSLCKGMGFFKRRELNLNNPIKNKTKYQKQINELYRNRIGNSCNCHTRLRTRFQEGCHWPLWCITVSFILLHQHRGIRITQITWME